MSLHLTSCRRADFSSTEAIDLARQVERGPFVEESFVCDLWNCEGVEVVQLMSAREKATLIAALRSFA
jgi:hypothetical protein